MKIWSLQALRFFAALAVVHHHATGEVREVTHRVGFGGVDGVLFGRCGVDLFFVLSGVVIALSARGLSPGEFVAKRARRVLAPYLLIGAPFLLVAAAMYAVGWRDVLASLVLWPVTDRMTAPALPVAWTLSFELLFYAATALVLWRPKALWPLLGLFVIAMALRSNPLLRFVGNPIILEFLMGVGLAHAPRWKPALLGVPLGLAALFLLAPTGYHNTFSPVDMLSGHEAWRRVAFLGLPAAAVVWGAMQIEMKPGVLTYLGDASYALYLIHLPIVLVTVDLLLKVPGLPVDVVVVVAMAAAVLLAWRVHELFEKPLLRRLRPRLAAQPA
jgi:exopolysaccharide production protein ExoZ